jgi:hypothetical protein
MEVGAFGYGGGHCNRLQSKATLNGTTEAVALPVMVHTLTEAGALEHPPRLISKKTKKIHKPVPEPTGELIPSPLARSGPAITRRAARRRDPPTPTCHT